MTRTAILPTTGDPYCCAAFLESYKRFWKSEVDTLRVFINGEMSDDIFNYVVDLFRKEGAIIESRRGRCGHGEPLDALVKGAKEDYIYITEDDFFVLKPGLVNYWFTAIEGEAHDAVGSRRGCCSLEICRAISSKFGLAGKDVLQPNFWPCLYLGKRESLQRVKGSFGPKNWKTGEIIEEVGYTVPSNTGGDTFVSASIELRAQGLRFLPVDQHRIIDVWMAKNYHPEWIHIGSCANAFVNLTDSNMYQLARLGNHGLPKEGEETPKQSYPTIPDQGIQVLYEEKMAMWKILRDNFPIPSSYSASWLNSIWDISLQNFQAALSLRPAQIAEKKQYLSTVLSPILS